MQRKTGPAAKTVTAPKPAANRGRSNLTNEQRGRVPVPSNRSTSQRRNGAAAKKPAKAPEKVEPKVDTRTAEEVDRDYKATLARFMAAKNDFEDSYKRKVEEIRKACGIEEAPE